MGRIAAPHGVKGWIKVEPMTADIRSLLDYRTWWISDAGGWQEHGLVDGRAQSGRLVVKLQGCDDRDAAAALKGQTVAVPREALPAARSTEYYWADLVGLRVVNAVEEDLGRVVAVMQTGANDVLVADNGRERLIPFIETVIREVDLAAGLIRVDWGADY